MGKVEILKANGTYNKRHNSVKKPEFMEDGFYDPMDVVQVKYEMLRDAEDSGRPIGAVAGEFGFSRTAYYNIKESFENSGMSSLVPEKPGPRRPRKLTEALQEFIDEYVDSHPGASATAIAEAIESERGETISKRTVERYAAKKKPL